jgi:hypothetical protein
VTGLPGDLEDVIRRNPMGFVDDKRYPEFPAPRPSRRVWPAALIFVVVAVLAILGGLYAH